MRRAAAREKMLFYSYEPDFLLATVQATRIAFPPHTQKCQDAYDKNPFASGVDCLEPDEPLAKMLARGVPADVARFWGSVRLTNAQVLGLLQLHRKSHGTRNRSV